MQQWKPKEVKPGDFFIRYDFDWKPGVKNDKPARHVCLIAATARPARVTYYSAAWRDVVLHLTAKGARPVILRHTITQYTIRKKQLGRVEFLPQYREMIYKLLESAASADGIKVPTQRATLSGTSF